MNMAGVNPGVAGGPVGGSLVMMNNGSPAMAQHMESSPEHIKELLNTYVYEYLVKSGLSDVARILAQKQDIFKMRIEKGSPNNRKGGEANGVDTDGMDMDMKNEFPDDLPRPHIDRAITGPNGFLFEWFSTFHDLYRGSQLRAKMGGAVGPGAVAQYLSLTQGPHRIREMHQGGGLGRGAGMNNQLAMNMRPRPANGVPNGMSADARKTLTPQQLQTYKIMTQSNNPQQMTREQAEVDMTGRPGTPAEGDNGGSPSKRPRLENQQFNGGMMPNGRPMQGGPPQGMMIQNSFNPQMNQNQFRPNGAMGQKPMPPNIANGMNLMNPSGSPMMSGMNQGQYGDNMALEMYNNGRLGAQPMPNAPGANNNGNHALQDYQMQLMLLEQQNKKRLMMARQEQDNAVSRDGGPLPMPVAPGMSPSGSRSGTSPNPTEQLKRAHMGGLPASPAGGENMQGRSPASVFMNGMLPGGDFNQAMFMGGEKPGMGGPTGPGMRPPTSMNMGQPPSRMAQPMMRSASQGGQQPMGTPGQRNDMPPPQAPAGGSAQRNQPPSPAPSSNAPPTPSQSNKAAPKSKKAKEAAAASGDSKKKSAKKSAQSNAGGDNEPPATPTPSTPITPQHPNSFNGPDKGQPGMLNNAQAPVSQMQPQHPIAQQPDMGASFEFGADSQNFNLDFSTLDNSDVLENFDFDSFLHTSTEEGFNFTDGMVGGDF
ncbi:hypothetical protein DV736_g4607, partial [Chaetothyriales sp. CBS 134916]